jgi:hypothetical protein
MDRASKTWGLTANFRDRDFLIEIVANSCIILSFPTAGCFV